MFGRRRDAGREVWILRMPGKILLSLLPLVLFIFCVMYSSKADEYSKPFFFSRWECLLPCFMWSIVSAA